MTFFCRLEVPVLQRTSHRFLIDAPKELDPEEAPILPEDLVSETAVIMRSCELLAETGARFRIGGFGVDDWNFDIVYDFSMFMEELPEALQELSNGNDCMMHLASQGVEKKLFFHPRGDEVRIECIPDASWKPVPVEEKTTMRELMAMLSQLALDFSRAVAALDADSAGFEPIRRWLRGEF